MNTTLSVQQYAERMAHKHGINPAKTAVDHAAVIITRLSDYDVSSSRTEDILVALKRNNIIDSKRLVNLLGTHYEEIKLHQI